MTLPQVFTDIRTRRLWSISCMWTLLAASFAASAAFGFESWPKGVTLAVTVIAGTTVAGRAWSALRLRQPSIELLVVIAAAGGLLLGEYWEAAVVTLLFVTGDYFESRALSRARQAVTDLLQLVPDRAMVLRGGAATEVSASEIQAGETIVVHESALFPVDGKVLEGSTVVDERSLTGEFAPVEKSPGSAVYAGTLNLGGEVRMQATCARDATVLAGIIRRVEAGQEERARGQLLIESFARWYLPGIVMLSALSIVWTHDLRVALTLLVISCPGALVIAIPVSTAVGTGRAAQRGILIKGGEHLETVAKVSALAFDKTGTLTEGRPELTDVFVIGEKVSVAPGASSKMAKQLGLDLTDAQKRLLCWAASAEANSQHPLARAVLAEAALHCALPRPQGSKVIGGKGVQVIHNEHRIHVGTESYLAAEGISVSISDQRVVERLRAEGKMVALIAIDGTVKGVLAASDRWRSSAAPVMRQLESLGIKRVVLLTGDHRQSAERIAHHVRIPNVYAELMPDDKVELVRKMRHRGETVAMVGDGINDAPAFGAADVAISMGVTGADLAVETADIVLANEDLRKIPEAIAIARATRRNIQENVAVAVLTAGAVVAGTLLGELGMAAGMLIHEVSVLAVIINALRLRHAR
jgi:Zn2+/Cd2+-exporting ATPase